MAEDLGKGLGLQLEGLRLDFRKHVHRRKEIRNRVWKREGDQLVDSSKNKKAPEQKKAHH